MTQRRNPRNTASWIIATVFGLFIVLGLALAFLQPQAGPEAAPAPAGAEGGAEVAPEQLAAAPDLSCEGLADLALDASSDNCQRIGTGQVCYGNNSVQADLVPGTTERFELPGDILPVGSVNTVLTSPLDPAINEWGIAVFQLQANLPGTVPGQNVTILVTGNVSLENTSGDMQAFYFTTGFGRPRCERLRFEGLVVDMAEGAGITLRANDAELTIQGTAVLEAEEDQTLTIGMLKGFSSVIAGGQEQRVESGQEVEVPMSGVSVTGPPSLPRLVSPDIASATCLVTGEPCAPESETAGEAGRTLELPGGLPTRQPGQPPSQAEAVEGGGGDGGDGGDGGGEVIGAIPLPGGGAGSGEAGGGGGSTGGGTGSGGTGSGGEGAVAIPLPGGGTGEVAESEAPGERSGVPDELSALFEQFGQRMLTVLWVVLGISFVALAFVILDQTGTLEKWRQRAAERNQPPPPPSDDDFWVGKSDYGDEEGGE